MEVKISTQGPVAAPRWTVCGYGGLGSGKTEFFATWPRPLFISAKAEKGWETLTGLVRQRPEKLFEQSFIPKVWVVDGAKDMMNAIKSKVPEYQKKDNIQTLVIDSLSYYADGVFDDQLQRQQESGKEDTRALYGWLRTHLRHVIQETHRYPLNICWLCLDKEPDKERGTKGGPLIAGRSQQFVPGACSLYIYFRALDQGQGKVAYEVHTQPIAGYAARIRGGLQAVKSPVIGGYRELMAAMGYQVGK